MFSQDIEGIEWREESHFATPVLCQAPTVASFRAIRAVTKRHRSFDQDYSGSPTSANERERGYLGGMIENGGCVKYDRRVEEFRQRR